MRRAGATVALTALALAGCSGSEQATTSLRAPAASASATGSSPTPSGPPSTPVGVDASPGRPPLVTLTPLPGRTPTVPSRPQPVAAPFYAAGDVDPGLEGFVGRARLDLAERLGVPPAAVTTHAAVLVRWPDGSLGCPQPGMSYAQVVTDGFVLELAHDGAVYRYHGGGARGAFLCQPPAVRAPARG